MSGWLAPAIVLGTIGLTIQGAKAAWDLFVSIGQRKSEEETLRLQWLGALLTVVDAIPGSQGERTEIRLRLLRENLPERTLTQLRRITKEVEGTTES